MEKIGNFEKKFIPSGGEKQLNNLIVVEDVEFKIAILLNEAGVYPNA